MTSASTLAGVLRRNAASFAPITSLNLNDPAVVRLNFTATNPLLKPETLSDTAAFTRLLNRMLRSRQGTIALGGYLEDRVIYRRSTLFDKAAAGKTAEPRTIHLGIDIWAHAGTAIYTPLDATIHSFADNATFGDYGPTIILQHELEGINFYTLFGHLSRQSLEGLQPGAVIKRGDKIAEIGAAPENGDWPPHLHFQIITDLLGYSGDFPGVCAPSEVEKFKEICPDPNLIIRSVHLAELYT